MTALAADFDTKPKASHRYAIGGPFPVAASALLYKGALCGFDSAGRVVECTAANGVHAAGASRKQNDNSSGAAAAFNVELEYGPQRFTNHATETLVQADVGKPVFLYDDNTVGKFTATAGGCVGILEEIRGAFVYVDIQPTDWANHHFDHDWVTEEKNNAAMTVAVGITRFTVAGTDASALPAGRYIGQRKRAMVIAASATPVLTCTPAAVVGHVAVVMDAASEWVEWRWTGAAWAVIGIGGATVTWT
jgi:hypothetical protein